MPAPPLQSRPCGASPGNPRAGQGARTGSAHRAGRSPFESPGSKGGGGCPDGQMDSKTTGAGKVGRDLWGASPPEQKPRRSTRKHVPGTSHSNRDPGNSLKYYEIINPNKRSVGILVQPTCVVSQRRHCTPAIPPVRNQRMRDRVTRRRDGERGRETRSPRLIFGATGACKMWSPVFEHKGY